MAENIEPPQEAGAGTTESELDELETRALFDALRGSGQLRSLGLTDNVGETVQAILCALRRNLRLDQVDIIRGLLPGNVDLIFATCERAHGRRSVPKEFQRDLFLDDLAEHLRISGDQALTVAQTFFQAMRSQLAEGDFNDACLFLKSEDLMDLLRYSNPLTESAH